MGSGRLRCRSARPGSSVAVRLRNSWQPMMGWMPLPVQAWANSSAPNRFAESVSATAGMPAALARAGSFSALIAPSDIE